MGTFVLAGAMASCAWKQDVEYRTRLEKTGKPAQHAVHGERLQALMQDLEALLFERQRTQIEIDADRQRYIEETIEVADGLMKSATHIAKYAEDLREDERTIFVGMQRKLVNQTLALRDLAKQGRADLISLQFDAITTTCNACHSNFREERER